MLLIIAAIAIAVAAAVRSTWSPCGWSMLSTLTPIGERARGTDYATSAAWFVTGSTVGGLALGALMAAPAAVVGAVGPAPAVVSAVVALAAAVAAAADAGLLRVPVHHRQVNERWLDGLRPWAYSAGFGLQIGTGFATYITTATLYLLVVLAAMTGSPLAAVVLGVLFGLGRGLAVLAGAHITTPDALWAFHRRFDALERPVRASVVGITVAVGAVSAGLLRPPVGGLVVAAAVLGVLGVEAVGRRRRARARLRRTTRITSA